MGRNHRLPEGHAHRSLHRGDRGLEDGGDVGVGEREPDDEAQLIEADPEHPTRREKHGAAPIRWDVPPQAGGTDDPGRMCRSECDSQRELR